MLDVRMPIGWMFTILGSILVLYGYMHYQVLGIPVGNGRDYHTIAVKLNIECGWPMICFGMLMLFLCANDRLQNLKREEKEAPESTPEEKSVPHASMSPPKSPLEPLLESPKAESDESSGAPE